MAAPSAADSQTPVFSSSAEAKSSLFSVPGKVRALRGGDQLCSARSERQRLGVEHHQLFLDPDRKGRRLGELRLDHARSLSTHRGDHTQSPPEPGFARREAHYRTVESRPQLPAHYSARQPETVARRGSTGEPEVPPCSGKTVPALEGFHAAGPEPWVVRRYSWGVGDCRPSLTSTLRRSSPR